MANHPVSKAEAEFNTLFWAVRKEHVRLKKQATTSDPAQKAAITFAKEHNWGWAEDLLEASRLNWSDDNDNALKILVKCEASVPASQRGTLLFLRGAALSAKGELDEAIKAYRKALETPKFDRPGVAWYNLGIALTAKGELDEAIKAYRKALDTPNFDTPGYAWNNLGLALKNKGELDEALKAYRNALNTLNCERIAKAWCNLGLAYVDAGKPELARDAFEKALAAPDSGGDHAIARLGLRMIESKLKPEALTPDDRALVEKPAMESGDSLESRLLAKVEKAGEDQYKRYMAGCDSKRENTLSILRGWSSAVTLLEGSKRRWRGGGYFLKWRGCGIVIDPGFDFLRNFHDNGFHGREINAVIVSHNHPDHNYDLKSIDDLCYELHKRASRTPCVILWDQDTNSATNFSVKDAAHRHLPIIFPDGFPQPVDLSGHPAALPFRITPFKVRHSGDARSAMGVVIQLLDADNKPVLRIGYTGDTSYFEELPRHLANCDVLIAHISQPTTEELQDATKLKKDHLGYRGVARLLKECQPKLALIGEFWAGYADLRIDLVKGLRALSGCPQILAAGLGMHVQLPGLEIECTECDTPTAFSCVKIAPAAEEFGDLAYLCPNCILQ